MTESKPKWKAELDAMQAICEVLDTLDHDTRVRVMAAVLCMHDQAMAVRVMRWWRQAG